VLEARQTRKHGNLFSHPFTVATSEQELAI
jgi:hypothetical protein